MTCVFNVFKFMLLNLADLVDFDDPVYKARKEVAELEEILPDIMGKVGRPSAQFRLCIMSH